MTAKLGADHPDTLKSMSNLALVYQAVGKMDRALPLFEQAATGFETRRFQHEYAKSIISSTIAAYETAQQFDKAESWRRKWLAVVKAEAGVASPAYAGELAALGLLLLKQQKWADAEPILRESLAIREKTQPDRLDYVQHAVAARRSPAGPEEVRRAPSRCCSRATRA